MISAEPWYRTVFAVDAESSTTLLNAEKARMRAAMYTLFTAALARGGITEDDRDRLIDRGDGVAALIRAVDRVPKTVLLRSVVPELSRMVDEHNRRHPGDRLRFRAVLHAGEVHHDPYGTYGEALDIAFRLLDSPVTKRALRRSAAPVVLAVSDDIYRSVVRHHYDGIDPLTYTAFSTRRNPSTWDEGWLHVPGEAVHTYLDSGLADRSSVTT